MVKQVTITLPEKLIVETKKSCWKGGKTFSGFIRQLLENEQQNKGESNGLE